MSTVPTQAMQETMPAMPAPLIPMHWIDTTPVESSDKPCFISSLDVQARVSGLYADVVVTLAIENPNQRDISADLSIPMPDRAVVYGYALDIDGQMIDGVVVPKDKARIAFETEQRRGVDPGLVEAVKGNVYTTRVYPIGSRSTRTVQLRYTAPLLLIDGRNALLDVPMPDERLAKRTMNIEIEMIDAPKPVISGVNGVQFRESGMYWRVESDEQDVAAGAGVRVALPQLPDSFAIVERAEDDTLWFTASELVPTAELTDVPTLDELTVLWDTSGSRAGIDHALEFELLRSYCSGVPRVQLIAFGMGADEPVEFESAEKLIERISSLHYDGATDFQSLSRILAEAPAVGEGSACVLFTDGMGTLGDAPASLSQDRRIVAIVSGSFRDSEYLRQACNGLAFDLAAAPKDARELARAIFHPSRLTGLEGEGVLDVLGIGSGSEGRYTVVGQLDANETTIFFENTGTEFHLVAEAAQEGATLSHAWAAIRVAQLSPRADENSDELLALGRRFGVVSAATSLLVLETLDQWLSYEIEPPKTWHKMHREWERRIGGMMKLSSEQGLKDDHVRNLKSAWADLRKWWERDFSENRPAQGNAFCPSCGSSVDANAQYCPRCGNPLSRGDERASYAMGDIMACEAVDGGMAFDDCMPMAASMEACGSIAYSQAPAPMMMMDACVAPDDPEPVDGESVPAAVSVKVQAWMPDAEYLDVLDAGLRSGMESVHDAYFAERAKHAVSPSFFIDCAGWFMANGDKAFGLKVLSNLAEMRIEDPALLRVMAWRLREAGELELALSVLRRVLKLRPEDSQSHRDVALVLDELARRSYNEGNSASAREYAQQAGEFFREIAFTPWQRRATAVALFAVEEYNVLRSWVDNQEWNVAPQLEPLGEGLEGVLDCDLRITLAWDADETDIDLHVTEPSGEEAYYAHRLTYAGGRVSEDITDGYGPELYEIKCARDGEYIIRAHYYASHQQAIFGPASCTLTVYTDWGRPTQAQTVTSVRLEDEKEMIYVGTASYGSAAEQSEQHNALDNGKHEQRVSKGSSVADVIAAYGEPAEGDSSQSEGTLVWRLADGRVRIATISEGKLVRLVEQMSWGEEMVIAQ